MQQRPLEQGIAPMEAHQSQPGEQVIQTSFRLPESRWKKLRKLSIEERSTVQSIIVTALEAEFDRRGIPF